MDKQIIVLDDMLECSKKKQTEMKKLFWHGRHHHFIQIPVLTSEEEWKIAQLSVPKTFPKKKDVREVD
jgi:hypothetical protein